MPDVWASGWRVVCRRGARFRESARHDSGVSLAVLNVRS